MDYETVSVPSHVLMNDEIVYSTELVQVNHYFKICNSNLSVAATIQHHSLRLKILAVEGFK